MEIKIPSGAGTTPWGFGAVSGKKTGKFLLFVFP